MGLVEAAAGVGGAVLDVVKKHREIADTTALMDAQRQISDWQASWDDPNNPNGVQSYKGIRSLQLHDAMLADFDKTVGNIDMALPSNEAKLRLRQYAQEQRARVQGSINDFANAQYGDYRAAQFKAFAASRVNDLTTAIVQDRAADVGGLWKSAEELIRQNGEAEGRPQEETDNALAAMKSRVHLGVVQQMATTDPHGAEGYLQHNEDKLLPEDRLTAFRLLSPIIQDAHAGDIANAILNGGELPPEGLGFTGANTNKPAPKMPVAMRGIVEKAADKYGVPHNLALALAWEESSFDPNAVGPETKYGRAKGLFQFLDSTAQSLGIDPLNPTQAADAAMKQLAEQAKSKGWAWAVAHHFAGPDPKQHGPKTRDYVREVFDKARRIGGQGGATVSPAANEAEAIARTQTIADPELRRATQTRIRDAYNLRDAQQSAFEQTTGNALFKKIAEADPVLPLTRILSPGELAFVAEHSELKGSIDRWRSITAKGAVVEDDPVLVDNLARLRANDPEAFKRVKLANYADRLSGKTLLDLTNDQAAANKPEKREDWATEEQLIGMAFDDMGLRGQGSAAQQGQFRQSYYRAKRRFIDGNKDHRAPTADEAQDIIDHLKLPFVKSSFLGFGGDTRRLYEGLLPGYDVPDDARREIIAEAKRNGVANPTDEQIARRYFDRAGSRK